MRYIAHLDSGIADGEELFTVIDEINDELIAKTVVLKEINRNLNTENERLKMSLEASEEEWGKCTDAALEEVEENSEEFFEVMDDLIDEKDKKLKEAVIRKRKMKRKCEKLQNKYKILERKIKFKNSQLGIKNKMLKRRIKTIMNKDERQKIISTCAEDESLLYDELYEGLCTYENSMSVHLESSSARQETVPLSEMDNPKIRETVHQRQEMLLDEFLKNEFKISTETESESE